MTASRCLKAASTVAIVVSLLACSTDPERAKQEYLKSGDRFFDQQKYSEAVVQYRNALQQDPRFGLARLKLAQSYERIGDRRNAHREYVRAADALPDRIDVQVTAATYLLSAGQFEDARTKAEAVLKKDPGNARAQILLGNALVGLRDFESALTELEEAVKLDPTSASALASLGGVQVVTGNAAEAEASYRAAVKNNPKMAVTHMALAQFLLVMRRWPEGEQSLKQALIVEPDNVLAHRAMAALLISTKRRVAAEPHLKALAAADTSPTGRMKLELADYYVSINRIDDASKVLEGLAQSQSSSAAGRRQAVIDYATKGAAGGNKRIDEVLARDPKNVAAILVKARFLVNERKIDEALKLARDAAAIDPSSIQAHYLLGTLYRQKGQPGDAEIAFNEVLKLNPRAVAAQLNLSELNLRKGARGPALQLAQDAVRQLPNSASAQLTLVRTLVANGQVAQAGRIAAALASRLPNAAAVQNAVGIVALAKRDPVQARRAFTKALELDPDNFEALSSLVLIDFGEGKQDAARARLEQRLAKTPEDSQLLVLGARVFAGSDANRAEQFLRKSIEVDPSNLDAFGMLTQLYLSQKKLPQARASLEDIIRTRPSLAGPQTMLAMLYEADGNRAEARKRYERVLELDPSAAVAANNLATIYAEDGGNLDVAFQLAQLAKQKLPNSGAVSDTLGWIYVKKDLSTMAIPHLEDAVAKSPKSANSYYHLGVALSKTGEHDKARRALERALALNLAPTAAAEARKLLAQS